MYEYYFIKDGKYRKMEKSEHLYYAKEIIKIFKHYSEIDLSYQDIKNIISRYSKRNKKYIQFYYKNRFGYSKVYPMRIFLYEILAGGYTSSAK